MEKYVKVLLNHTGKVYEYKTDLPMALGKTYRIKAVENGWAPPMRAKVVSESLEKTYYDKVNKILAVEEAEEF